MIKLLLVSSILGLVRGECPNACSSHGKCTAYDMCLCYRNWMSNDCSERVCQFGLAHVDTPKGDLDSSSGELDGPETMVAEHSEVYPYGTTEQFPLMIDSDENVLANTAHYYMECSNKGICDRENGVCECFPGYEGSACQRASCPSNGNGVCSGHGTCETIKQIAKRDSNNVYELWDEDATLGCVCDPGYYGPDCSARECKFGADPLYYDDNSNIRYSNWTFVMATAPSSGATLSGTYSIIFYDHHGEDWETEPLDASATCADIINALEDIPNDVIPDESVRCVKHANNRADSNDFYTLYSSTAPTIHNKFTIMFPQNPGYLKEIRLNKYLDGYRPTLHTSESESTLMLWVYADGFSGEDVDIVPDECEHVLVTLGAETSFGDISSATKLVFQDDAVQRPLLKRCLGDADNRTDFTHMANEVYDWDYGTDQNPHLIKLIEATPKQQTRICKSINDFAYVDQNHVAGWCFENSPAGFYVPLIYNVTNAEFMVYANSAFDYDDDTLFRVFTTKGYLNRVARDAEIFTKDASWQDYHSNVVYSINYGPSYNFAIHGEPPVTVPYRNRSTWSGSVDCETRTVRDIYSEDCLDKGDYVMFFNTEDHDVSYTSQPRYHNMYRVKKIAKELPEVNTGHSSIEPPYRNQITLDMHVNFRYRNTGGLVANLATRERLRAYKFYPPTNAVTYVEQCSGRGLCNSEEGVCECFTGYTYDDCSVQNSAAK